jgi:conjugal transfer pilus assembly protein TraK
MLKWMAVFLALFSTVSLANNILVKDNSDITLTLSRTNYNRIVMKNDKIIEAVFPEQAMNIKRDEQDGSVYVKLGSEAPFTLFFTTESGHHFSATVNGEESLGKTIELSSQSFALPQKNVAKNSSTPKAIDPVPQAILALLTHMEEHKIFADVVVKRQFNKVLRWSKGLTLFPKELWDGQQLKGEIIELYNGGKKTLALSQEWFAKQDTLAIKFSKPSINPGERAMLYRVQGVSHA